MSLKAASIFCSNTTEAFASPVASHFFSHRHRQTLTKRSWGHFYSGCDGFYPLHSCSPEFLVHLPSPPYLDVLFLFCPPHLILQSHRGPSSWRGCFLYKNTPIGRQAPLSDTIHCSHMDMKSVLTSATEVSAARWKALCGICNQIKEAEKFGDTCVDVLVAFIFRSL